MGCKIYCHMGEEIKIELCRSCHTTYIVNPQSTYYHQNKKCNHLAPDNRKWIRTTRKAAI